MTVSANRFMPRYLKVISYKETTSLIGCFEDRSHQSLSPQYHGLTDNFPPCYSQDTSYKETTSSIGCLKNMIHFT